MLQITSSFQAAAYQQATPSNLICWLFWIQNPLNLIKIQLKGWVSTETAVNQPVIQFGKHNIAVLAT